MGSSERVLSRWKWGKETDGLWQKHCEWLERMLNWPAPKAQVEVDESWIDAIEQKEAKEREAWLGEATWHSAGMHTKYAHVICSH